METVKSLINRAAHLSMLDFPFVNFRSDPEIRVPKTFALTDILTF